MRNLWGTTLLALSISMLAGAGVQAIIVPDEVPSLLSVIYSNIPTIKKGTDSRLGWGFRLGNRADFQVLVELGPQQETQPLGNQQPDSSGNKRQALDNLSNVLYAQRLREKQENKRKKAENKLKLTMKSEQQHQQQQQQQEATVSSEAGKWLENWSKSVRQGQKAEDPTVLKPQPGISIGEIDAKSVIPPDDVESSVKVENFTKLRPLEITTGGGGGGDAIVPKEGALDDVSLD